MVCYCYSPYVADYITHCVCLKTSETGSVGGLGHIGTVHPVGNRRAVLFGYRLDEIPQAGALADGDGEADIHPAADGDHGVGIEAAVGPHRELAPGPTGNCAGRCPGWREL